MSKLTYSVSAMVQVDPVVTFVTRLITVLQCQCHCAQARLRTVVGFEVCRIELLAASCAVKVGRKTRSTRGRALRSRRGLSHDAPVARDFLPQIRASGLVTRV
jgi:hypothetical protein